MMARIIPQQLPETLPLIPATRDTVVHYLFGTRGFEDILKSFVNAVLQNAGRKPVVSVEMLNPFNPKTFVNDKHTILDVKATDKSGRIFAIEFQTFPQVSFEERLLYYWATTYVQELQSKGEYRTLNPVISIAVTGYRLFKPLPWIHNVFSIVSESDPQYRLTDDLQIHTLEIIDEKIHHLDELKPALRRWVIFFYYADKKSEAEMKVLLKGDPVIGQAYSEYLRFNADTKMRAIHEARERYLHDYYSDIGEAQRKRTLEIALKMKQENVSFESIARFTGLSTDEISRLS
jgi:predicted transposase/invertase (TIGR01784 family)